jgi:hypothetical protein
MTAAAVAHAETAAVDRSSGQSLAAPTAAVSTCPQHMMYITTTVTATG